MCLLVYDPFVGIVFQTLQPLPLALQASEQRRTQLS